METPHPSEEIAVTESSPFAEEYYKHGFGPIPYERNEHWLQFFGGIAHHLVESIKPRTMFDAGCAWGFLVEAFQDLGVDAHGTDVSSYAISQVRPDMQPRCNVASLTAPILGGPYDLLTCIEVLEHMEEKDGLQAIEHLTNASDTILFSSTPSDFDEATHVNVREPMYWLQFFAEAGFYPDLLFDASFVAPHAFLVRKQAHPMREDALLLFAEVLQLRMDRVAFLQRQTRVEELEQDTQRLNLDLQRAASTATSLSEKRDALEATIARLTEESKISYRDSAAGRIAHEQLQASARQFSELTVQFLAATQELASAKARLDETREQVAASQDQLKQLGLHATELAGELQRARETAARLPAAERQLAAVTQEGIRWKSEAETRAVAQREAETIVSELTFRLDDVKQRAVRAEHLFEEWRLHCVELSGSLETIARRNQLLDAQLESISISPAWQVILRGRAWIAKNRWRRPWIRRYLEPGIRWGFQKALGRARSPRPREEPVAALTPSIELPETIIPPLPVEVSSPALPFKNRAADYQRWIARNEPTSGQLDLQRQLAKCFSYQPKISVLVPVYIVPLPILKATVDSVIEQTFGNWELCVSIPEADNPEAATYLKSVAEMEPRIRVKFLTKNEGISGNSNHALELASGEYLALLDHDDTLAPFALFEIVQLLNQDPSANFIYSDKDLISEDGKVRFQPLFKPTWSPEIMLNANYLTHLCVMRTGHVRALGGWRKETDGAQDWDLFLRIIQTYGEVRHVPKVLYHWREISTSVAQRGLGAKPYAEQGQIRTVKDHCRALGLTVDVIRHEAGDLRVVWPIAGKISVIYVTGQTAKQGDAVLGNAQRIAALTDYPNFEILLAQQQSGEASSVHCVAVSAHADLRERINALVRYASGEILVFIDERVVPAESHWLSELAGPLQLADVGMVGSRLVDSRTHMLRHCGIVFTEDGRAEYLYAGQPEHVYEQFGGASWYRNWSAISGACFAIRRVDWERVDGIAGDAFSSRPDFNLCLKMHLQTRKRILYNPFARLLQSGEATFEIPLTTTTRANESLQRFFQSGDPHFNANLVCRRGQVAFREQSTSSGGTDYAADSRALVTIYDFSTEQLKRCGQMQSKRGTGKLDTITWLLPEFGHAFYGGVHTILRFADAFQQQYRIESRFCIFGHTPDAVVRSRIASAFPKLKDSQVTVLDDHRRIDELAETDAAVCSLWSTAYAALDFNKARKKFYFIQDDEPLFYPAGSTSALVEASYGFGFHGLCNTVSLLERYVGRGGQGEFFNPCIDPTIFHDRGRNSSAAGVPYLVFCYARPDHSRNCFELLAESLREVKRRLGNRVVLVTAGASWDVKAHGLEGVVENIGLLNYQSTGALYRACDLGLVMMMTRHPSYLPMELMACGALVVTNRNHDTAWLLKDDQNCLLADPSRTSLAERIIEGLENADLRRRVTSNAKDMVASSYSNWKEQIGKIHRYMKSQC